LVLDAGNSSGFNPIDGAEFNVGLLGGGVQRTVNRAVNVLVAIAGLEFFEGLVTEDVHSHGVAVVLLVAQVDLVHVALEDGVSVEEVFVGVFLGVLGHPFGEEELVFVLFENGGRGEGEPEESEDDGLGHGGDA